MGDRKTNGHQRTHQFDRYISNLFCLLVSDARPTQLTAMPAELRSPTVSAAA